MANSIHHSTPNKNDSNEATEQGEPLARAASNFFFLDAPSTDPADNRAQKSASERTQQLLEILRQEGVSNADHQMRRWPFDRLVDGVWSLWDKRGRGEFVGHGGKYVMSIVFSHQYFRVPVLEDLSFLDDWETGQQGIRIVK